MKKNKDVLQKEQAVLGDLLQRDMKSVTLIEQSITASTCVST